MKKERWNYYLSVDIHYGTGDYGCVIVYKKNIHSIVTIEVIISKEDMSKRSSVVAFKKKVSELANKYPIKMAINLN